MITIRPINEVYITSLVIHMFIISDIDTSVTWGVHVYVLKEFIKKEKKELIYIPPVPSLTSFSVFIEVCDICALEILNNVSAIFSLE